MRKKKELVVLILLSVSLLSLLIFARFSKGGVVSEKFEDAKKLELKDTRKIAIASHKPPSNVFDYTTDLTRLEINKELGAPESFSLYLYDELVTKYRFLIDIQDYMSLSGDYEVTLQWYNGIGEKCESETVMLHVASACSKQFLTFKKTVYTNLTLNIKSVDYGDYYTVDTIQDFQADHVRYILEDKTNYIDMGYKKVGLNQLELDLSKAKSEPLEIIVGFVRNNIITEIASINLAEEVTTSCLNTYFNLDGIVLIRLVKGVQNEG